MGKRIVMFDSKKSSATLDSAIFGLFIFNLGWIVSDICHAIARYYRQKKG